MHTALGQHQSVHPRHLAEHASDSCLCHLLLFVQAQLLEQLSQYLPCSQVLDWDPLMVPLLGNRTWLWGADI